MSMVTAAEAMAGVAGVIVAIKVGIPRSKLLYGTTQLGQVLADPDLAALLDVTLRGRKLSNSFLLEVWLVNHSLWDITARAFAGPIELNVQSAEIIEVVGIDMAPATPTAPAVVRDGSSLFIKPCLINRGQQIYIRLLTDGRPRVSVKASIAQVALCAVAPPPRWVRSQAGAVLAACAAGVVMRAAVGRLIAASRS